LDLISFYFSIAFSLLLIGVISLEFVSIITLLKSFDFTEHFGSIFADAMHLFCS